MGQIVSIVSSPREGKNSDTIVNKIMEGAMGISTNTFSLYYVAHSGATGCMACMKCKKEGHCVRDDEISKALEDIRRADALIVSTPVYFGQASWAYRAFEDRMFSFIGSDGKTTLPPGKELIIVVTYSSGYDEAVGIADHIESIMVERFGFKLLGMIIYCDHGNPDEAANDDRIREVACQYGTSLNVSKPFGTYVVSIPEGDARRGNSQIPNGLIWSSK